MEKQRKIREKEKCSTTVAEVADAAAYKDGTYYGSATGFAGPIKVKVVISGGKIASIEIVSTSDGSSYISKAFAITGKIVSSQRQCRYCVRSNLQFRRYHQCGS
ncbi:MAG: hypothetical protein V8R46_10100 [Eubacterium ramulus]